MSITLVYHSKCQASTNILPLLKEIKNYDVDYIDIHTDKIETDIKDHIVNAVDQLSMAYQLTGGKQWA